MPQTEVILRRPCGTRFATRWLHDLSTLPFREEPMQPCHVCGNKYQKAFTVTRGAETYTFDSLECAIQRLAPSCAHCGCRVIGHGLEADEVIYCCAHCARERGVFSVVDNA
jgi:hypothetical protein